MSGDEHLREVAKRLGVTQLLNHWFIYAAFGDNVWGQVLHRVETNDGELALQVGWAFDANPPRDLKNMMRGTYAKKLLDAATPKRNIYLRATDNNCYVGLIYPVPASPSPAFYDDVAEGARWVIAQVNPTDLLKIK